MRTSKTEVVSATQDLVDALKGRLREDDKEECWAMAHVSADFGLQYSFDRSDLCWVALVDDVPTLCFGVGRVSIAGNKGAPWLLGTDDVQKIGLKLVRHSKEYIEQMLEPFDILENWVDMRNRVSIAWLKWCGFTIEDPIPYGPDGRLFHRFWMKKRR